MEARPAEHLLPPLLAVAHLPQITVSDADAERLRQGRRIATAQPLPEGEVVILDSCARLSAIGQAVEGGHSIQPAKVFPARA